MSMSLPPITLAVFGALPDATPLAEVPINPRVTSITYSTQAPGGFERLQIGLGPTDDLPMPYLAEPVIAERRSHVTLTIGGHRAWEGVLTRIGANGTTLEALGYGIVAPGWGSLRQGGSTPVDTRVILVAAVRACPFLVPVEITDPGGQRSWGDFQYQDAASVFGALLAAGDATDRVALLMTTYDERATRIVPKLPPDVCDYRLSFDPATMTLDWDYAEVVDGVYVVWQDADGVTRATDTLYRDGVTSATAVVVKPLHAAFPDGGAALQFARVYLAQHSDPRLTGSIRLGMDDALVRPDGERVPGYLVRAGEWVEVEGEGCVPILRTDIEWLTQQVTIQLDAPPSTSWAATQRRMLDAARAARTMTDPISGNRRAG